MSDEAEVVEVPEVVGYAEGRKDHFVKVSVESYSFGKRNGSQVNYEDADNIAELMYKHDAIYGVVQVALDELIHEWMEGMGQMVAEVSDEKAVEAGRALWKEAMKDKANHPSRAGKNKKGAPA